MERKDYTARLGGGKARSLIPSVLRALLLTLLLFGVLLLALAFVLYRTEDPGSMLTPAAIGIAGASAAFGGLFAGRIYRTGGSLAGLLHGMLLVFLLLLGAIVAGGGSVKATALPFYLGMLILSTIGGRIGAKKKHRRTARRRS